MFPAITYGKSPYNLILLHGGPAAPGSISFLGQKLSMVHGALQVGQDKSSISSLLMHIDEQINQLAAEKVVLIGHSFGAWIAGLYASRYPQKIRKIILVGMGPLKNKYTSLIHQKRMKRLSETKRQVYLESLENLSSIDVPRAKLAIRRLQMLTEITDQYNPFNKYDFSPPVDLQQFNALNDEMEAYRSSGKLLNEFGRISCPISIIHGTFDPHPIQGITEPFQEKRVKHSVIIIEKCGHEPWMEQEKSGEFYEILEKEIQTV